MLARRVMLAQFVGRPPFCCQQTAAAKVPDLLVQELDLPMFGGGTVCYNNPHVC